MTRVTDNRWWGIWLGVAVWALLGGGVGCDEKGGAESASSSESAGEKVERNQPLVWEAGEPIDLREPPAGKRETIELTDPTTYPPCHELLENDGEPRPELLPGRDDPALVLAGCQPEALVRRDGRQFVAYKLPEGDGEAGDLRLAVYGTEGRLEWSGRMDRSAHADDFAALRRSSFIALMLPRLVCAGTLWEGGTQVACWKAETGELAWNGELSFWSGIPLQAAEGGLHGADISGLTRRYPYSGTEMRRVDFEHSGGHSALYLTDGERLFYAPNKNPPVRMVAYDFTSMTPEWRAELPGHPDPGYNRHAVPEHDLGVIKIGETLHGFDTATGDHRWALGVGDDRPPLAASEDRVYLLVLRSEEPTLLYALEPKSGEIDWWAPVPTGTLEVGSVDGTLTIRSVRAVQQVHRD